MVRMRLKDRSAAAVARLLGVLPVALLAACAALAGCSAQRGTDARLVRRLDAILNRHADSGARVSARVIDLGTRRVLYQTNIDVPRMPASNMKLLTVATALDVLGADDSLKTYLAVDGDDLWLIGTGDPAVADARIARTRNRAPLAFLDDWTRALRDRGITRIKGDLVYYDGAFESLRIHPSWEHDDLVHWYAAPVSGLNLNDNCIDVTVTPTSPGQPVDFAVTPPTHTVVVINNCVTGDGGTPSIDRIPFSDVYVIGGRCAKRRSLKSKPVGDPGYFFADVLRAHLLKNGITIDGRIRSSPVALGGVDPPPADTIVAVYETPLSDILWRILQNSQNLFAECLGKRAGQVFDAAHGERRPGSWAGADRAIRGFLSRCGIDHRGLVVADCSGLSRDNRVTVRLVTDLLAVMFDHPAGAALREHMARPGGNGTLRKRMKDIREHVYAKTGYIRGVRALSGYVHTDGDRWLCFSIIYNNIPGSVQPFNKLQDEVCRVLVRWPETDEQPGAPPSPSWARVSPGSIVTGG